MNQSNELAKRSAGIYLVKPHAEMIWNGEKSLIVLSNKFEGQTGEHIFYLDNKFCYGIIKLKEPKIISLKEFESLENRHKITEEEKSSWLEGKNEFYAYEFDILDNFENPRPISVDKGIQTFVPEVKFFDKYESLSFYEDAGFEEIFELGAFGSPGGKTRIVDQLLALVPSHETYVEPFAGGAALYWKKEPSKLDILNDKNTEIAYAYKFIKEATTQQVMKLRQYNWMPSKLTFFKLKNSTPPEDLTSRFYRFYYILFYSYGANLSSYGYKTQKVHIFERIAKLQERMKNTKLYNENYLDVIKKYNSKDTFVYLDPPYPDEWPGPEGTKCFTKEHVQEMHDYLKNEFGGKFLLSINNLEWISSIFKDFNISRIKVPRSFRHNDSPKYELLISNYTIPKENASTGSTDIAGSPVEAGGLQPVKIIKPKEEDKKEEKPEEIELIKDMENYDPTKIANEVLVDDWRIVNVWYATYKKTDGKGIKFSKETIVNMAKLIYDEIIKRVKEEKMNHTFEPDKMEPSSRELYEMVSSNSFLMSDIRFLDYLKDFIVIKDCISLIGSSVTQEHKPNDIDLLIRMGEPDSSFLKRAIESRISKMFPENLQDKLHFVWGEKEGPHDSFIPLFDLQFKRIISPKVTSMNELSKVNIMEPYSPMKPLGSAYYDIGKFLEALI